MNNTFTGTLVLKFHPRIGWMLFDFHRDDSAHKRHFCMRDKFGKIKLVAVCGGFNLNPVKGRLSKAPHKLLEQAT